MVPSQGFLIWQGGTCPPDDHAMTVLGDMTGHRKKGEQKEKKMPHN